MIYKWIYKTKDNFDDILLYSDGEYLTRVCFVSSKNKFNQSENEIKNLPIFKETCRWLDSYFNGQNPKFIPKYKLNNLTSFRKEVIDIISTISFGKTMTYNDIAKIIAKNRGIKRMSSRAVGNAIGWNPIGIIIPCHRIVGSNGNLTGYNGGIKNKMALLTHEQNDMQKFFIPKNK